MHSDWTKQAYNDGLYDSNLKFSREAENPSTSIIEIYMAKTIFYWIFDFSNKHFFKFQNLTKFENTMFT